MLAVCHIVFAFILTAQNRRARGEQRYEVTSRRPEVSWASQNMLVLGIIILLGIGLHLYNFWYHMQFAEIAGMDVMPDPQDGFGWIKLTFANPVFSVLYLVWICAIWFHLSHGFWSAMQTLGWSGKIWLKRWQCIGLKATNANGQIKFIADLPIDGKYYVKEIYAPDGFVTSEEKQEFTFEYGDANEPVMIYNFTFEDEPITVEITKADLTTGEEIPGAHLKVADKDGNVIEVFNRIEKKYLISEDIYGKFYNEIIPYMEFDKYCKDGNFYSINNLYYDTDSNEFSRNKHTRICLRNWRNLFL